MATRKKLGMKRRHRARIVSIHLAVLAASQLGLAPRGAAQGFVDPMASPSLGGPLSIVTGFSIESWKEDRDGALGQRLSQVSTYALTTVPLNPRATLQAASAWASADWQDNGSTSGLRDTRLTFSYIASDRIVLRAGANVPTGQTELAIEDLRLARGLASRLKGFRASQFGEGFDLDLGIAFAGELRGLAVGLGAGYTRKGAYTIFEDQEEYDPGDKLTFVAGVDRNAATYLWRADAILDTYGRDQLGGRDAFQFGTRLRFETLYRHRGGERTSWQVRGRTILQGNSDSFAQHGSLASETGESRGREMYVDGQLESQVASRIRLLGLAGARSFGGSDTGEGDGYRFDVGPGVRAAIASRAWLTGGFRYSWGKIEVLSTATPDGTDSVGLSGYTFEIGLELAGAR